MAAKLAVKSRMDAKSYKELEDFASHQGLTVDQIHEFIESKGVSISRNAAWHWKQQFDIEGPNPDMHLLFKAVRLMLIRQEEIIRSLGVKSSSKADKQLEREYSFLLSALLLRSSKK